MTCAFPSILNINDGSMSLDVHGHAFLRGTYGQADTQTGHGVIEYADGSAKRWVRFQAREWIFSGSGPAPSGLWSLDLTAATWTATFPDPDNIGATVVAAVVPARPDATPKDVNTAERPWTLTLREASAR